MTNFCVTLMLVDTKIVVLKQKRMAEPEPVVLSMEGRERRGSYKNGAMGVERFFFFFAKPESTSKGFTCVKFLLSAEVNNLFE